MVSHNRPRGVGRLWSKLPIMVEHALSPKMCCIHHLCHPYALSTYLILFVIPFFTLELTSRKVGETGASPAPGQVRTFQLFRILQVQIQRRPYCKFAPHIPTCYINLDDFRRHFLAWESKIDFSPCWVTFGVRLWWLIFQSSLDLFGSFVHICYCHIWPYQTHQALRRIHQWCFVTC